MADPKIACPLSEERIGEVADAIKKEYMSAVHWGDGMTAAHIDAKARLRRALHEAAAAEADAIVEQWKDTSSGVSDYAHKRARAHRAAAEEPTR